MILSICLKYVRITTQRARLRGSWDATQDLDLVHRDRREVQKTEVFNYHGVRPRTGYNILSSDFDRTRLHEPLLTNFRVREARKISWSYTHNAEGYTRIRG